MRILRIYPLDQSFEEIERRATENKIRIDKNQIATGQTNIIKDEKGNEQSTFVTLRERPFSKFKFWKKRRTLAFYFDGSLKIAQIGLNGFYSQFGTLEEIKKYIAGEIAKTKSRQKAMETWQFIILAVLLAGVIGLQLYNMGIFTNPAGVPPTPTATP